MLRRFCLKQTSIDEEFFADAFLAAANEGMLVVNAKAAKWKANNLFRRLWSLNEEHFPDNSSLQKLMLALFRQTDYAFHTRKLRYILQSRAVYHDVVRLKNGRTLTIRTSPILSGNKIKARIWSFSESLPPLPQKLHSTLASSMHPYLLFHFQAGTIVYVSPLIGKLLDFKGITLTGKNVFELYRQAPQPGIANMLRFMANRLKRVKALNSLDVNETYTFPDASGRQKHFRIILKPVYYQPSQPALALCMINDETIWLNKLQSLRNRKQALEQALHAMNDGMIVTDDFGRVRDMNLVAEELTGYKVTLVAGKQLEEVYHIFDEKNGERQKNLIPRIFRETYKSLENRYLLKSSSDKEYIISEKLVPLKGPDGKTEGAVIVFRDITYLQNMQKELQKSEALYSKLFRQAPVGIALFDKHLNLVAINPKLAELVGYKINELAGINIREIDERGIMAPIMQTAIAGKSLNKEIKYKPTRKKREIDVQVQVTPLNNERAKENGNGGIAIIQDITQQRTYEQILKRNRLRTLKSEELKSHFLKNMSHNIRTPLNWIMGYTSLLKHEVLSQKERLDYISSIEQSGNQLLRMLDNILAFSRLEIGEVEVRKKWVSLNSFVRKLIKEVSQMPVNDEKNADLQFVHKDIEDDYQVLLDESILHQTVIQLLINAVQYTEQSPKIKIGYDLIGSARHSLLLFYVKDNGPGIPADKKKAIFQQFQRGSYIVPDALGTGLGLTIAKGYARILDGKLWAESAEGYGSIFYFLLPVEVQRPSEEVQIEREIFYNRKLLIHSDNSKSFRFLQMVASDYFMTLQYEQAINHIPEKIAESSPDIILVNYEKMDAQLRKFLRIAKDLPRCPVIIILLAFGNQRDLEELKSAGIEMAYIKPVAIKWVLQSALQRLVKA